jgi:phenylacetate-CoA ligase
MNSHVLNVYHHLPPGVQSMTASLRGLYLRSWRYGRQTRQIIDEAIEREHWPAADWARFQRQRLAHILNRAANQVPFYKRQWEERRRRGDTASPAILQNWPILEKDTLRAQSKAFVAEDCHPRWMFHEQTSGTTGTPVDLWCSRATVRLWYGLSEARWRGWYGVSANDRWAILGGQLVTPASQRHAPFWVWNQALNQLYMSCYHLSAEFIPYYLDALHAFRVRYLWGYPSALYTLAREAVRLGYTFDGLVVAIANAEPVSDAQREAVARAFGCPLRETYGMAEKTVAAGECEAGRLHLWPEVGLLEVMEGERPVPAGTCGDLVCTGLLDEDMPLVRYRLGDRGAIDPETQCECGRTLPLLQSIEGRSDDMVTTADGRRVGRLDTVFKSDLPIREAQIIQEAVDHLRIRYVADDGFSPDTARRIVRLVRERLGDVRVTLEAVDAIPRAASGKFRAVMSRVSADDACRADAVRD